MSNKLHKEQRQAAEAKAKKENDAQSVKMKFNEDKYYKDLNVVHFEKGKVYDIHGADQIQRWLKRGGEIVQGQLKAPVVQDNPSKVVQNPQPKPAPQAAKPVSPVKPVSPLKPVSPAKEEKEEDKESSIEMELDSE